MYNSRRRIPASTKFNAVSPGKLGDPVVSGLILEQTLSDFFLGAVGVKAEISHRKTSGIVVVLSREVISLRLALPANTSRGVEVQMEVMEQGQLIVEEFRVHRPSAVFLQKFLADQLGA